MTALLTLLAGLVLAAAGWWWASGALDRAARMALVAVLGVVAATCNVVIPVPSIELTTTVVLCAAAVLGVRTGIGVGLVAVIGSSIAGGVGTWTAWQVVAAAVVALIGAAVGAVHQGRGADWSRRSDRILLGVAAVLATLAWDVIVTVGTVASYATQPGLSPLQQVVSALLVGAAFTLTHVAFTTAFTVLGAPPLMHALARARPRLDGGEVTTSLTAEPATA